MKISIKSKDIFNFRYYLLFIALIAILLRALEVRLPSITRALWEDEIHHNYLILWADNLYKILEYMGAQSQPFLDYFLRKIVWNNLFGYNEITFRIPSLFYSLFTIAFGYFVTYLFFIKARASHILSIACGTIVGVWILNNPTEIHYSAEARHYSLTSLISLLWFYFFFMYDKENKKTILFMVSLAFANTHFFSFPIILSGYFIDSTVDLFNKNYKSSILNCVAVIAIVFISIKINFSAWHWITNAPPGKTTIDIYQGIIEGDRLWNKFISYLSFPIPLRLIIIIMFFNIRSLIAPKILYYLFFILPLFFVYTKLNSSYPFGLRYFTPFFGLGFVIIVYFIFYFYTFFERVPDVVGKFMTFLQISKHNYRLKAILTWAFIISFSYQFHIQRIPLNLYREINKIKMPSMNFSYYYDIYQELKNERVPIFLINEHCWANDIPKTYFEFIGSGYNKGFEVVCARGCETDLKEGNFLLNEFLNNNPFGVIVFDNKRESCDSFHEWETPFGGPIPHWPKGEDLKFRWSRKNSAMVIRNNSKEVKLFLRCAHPDIKKNPVSVKVLSNEKIIKEVIFKDHQWKHILIEPNQFNGFSFVNFQVSRTWNPKVSGFSDDYRDIGVAVAIPGYDSIYFSRLKKIKRANRSVWSLKNPSSIKEVKNIAHILGLPLQLFEDTDGFYRYETWTGGVIPGWPKNEAITFRWTSNYATIDTQRELGKEKILFMLAGHPDIGINPVEVKILSNNKLLKSLIFSDQQWKKIEIEPHELHNSKKLVIQVSRTWKPKNFSNSKDFRDLGVAVAILKN